MPFPLSHSALGWETLQTLVSDTGIAPAAMRKMGGPYSGTGHATLLAAMCGVLTSHGTTLPALGLTPGDKVLPGEQVGLG